MTRYKELIRIFVGKCPAGRPRTKSEGNIKVEIGYEDQSWMELAQDHDQWCVLVLAVLNILVLIPQT
jgi:hypothetical protein